jgi:DNA-damage-inducible protein J
MKNQIIHVNVNDDLKQEVERIFKCLGLSPDDAIRLFYEQVSQHKGLPFFVDIPNAITAQAINDAREQNLTPIAELSNLFDA